MKGLPRDHEARTAALDPTCSMVVQAPAGSGKTELLTDRILALLPTVRRPEEIVAITFTRKAAAEMHARVMEKLAAAELPPPDAPHARKSWELARRALDHDRRHDWQLLQFPARLAIQTIDALCASLTRRMPYLSYLGGAPRVTSEPAELYAQAARATLELADDPTYGEPVRALLAHLDVNPAIAADLLAAMLGSRDQWLPYLERGADRETLERDLYDAVCQDLQAIQQSMPRGWQHEVPALARAAQAMLATTGNQDLDALADWADGHALLAEPEALPQWRALATLLLTKTNEPRKSLNKNIGFPPGCTHKQPMQEWLAAASQDTSWAARLAQTMELPDGRYSEAQWTALTALFGSLRLAAAQLQVIFGQTGQVDFTEVTQRALQALGSADDPSELLLRMDARIQHLLIDEFQDTSQPQIDLLERLTAGWMQGDGRTLFLVGDPMQSIYRFRKAEVALFLRVAQHGVGGITLRQLTLTDNFRSQAGIVEWVNQRFSALFPKQHDAAQSAIAYAHSHAFRPPLDGPAVQFHAVWLSCSDIAQQQDGIGADANASTASLPPLPEAEHDVVVRLVREAIAGNRGDDDDRNVAILVRARSHARAISRRLSEAGIAHRAVELTRLAQRPVVADLTQLARALAHPADRLAWLCVLRAPWCGLTLASLTALVGDDHDTPVPALLDQRADLIIEPNEAARLSHVLDVLRDRSNDSGSLPFAAWVETVWRRLGGRLAYPTKRDSADAESFFRLLEEVSPYGPPDPARLSDALQRLYASPDPAPQGRNVQIMTMHKSKGLQFDTVILPGLHARAPAEPRRLLWLEHHGGKLLAGPIKPQAEAAADPISQFLARRDTRRAEFELDRLLYVASTRARHRLHLVAELDTDARTGSAVPPHRSSLLARLWRVLDDMVPPSQTTAGQFIPQEPGEPLPAAGGDAGGASGNVATMMRMPISALHDINRANRTGPASAGSVDTENSVSAVQQMLLDAGNQLERITGEVAHAWLEHIAHEGPEAWDIQRIAASSEQIAMQLSRKGLPTRDHEAAHAIVLDTLTATLADERGRWLLAQSAQREWRLLDARGKQLVVDLAFETEDGWLVVDYKTSLAHHDESAAAFEARMRTSYTNQLRRYCAAVSAATGSRTRAALYLPRMRLWIDLVAI